jgi:hypothetical protein
MARKQNTTDTISDKDWNKLQRRARRANPQLDDITDPSAIRRRRQSAEQLKNVTWS